MARFRSRRAFFALLLLIFALCFQPVRDVVMFVSDVAFNDNLHQVSDGRFYRSAQMSPGRLTEVIRKYKIKTVIDIRAGEASVEEYGFSEPEVVEGLGAKYRHVPLIGSRMPTRDEVTALLTVYDSAEEPILIHDSSGTHRAGTASAIWLLTRQGASLVEAQSQLRARFGFFRQERAFKSWIQGHPTIDYLIWKFSADHAKSGVEFRKWLKETEER